MRALTQRQADVIFEQLMRRPSHYSSMSYEQQWDIDRDLGILDHEIPPEFYRPEYDTRWKAKFK